MSQFLSSADCPVCKGKRLKPEALSVTFAGLDIAEMARLPLRRLNELIQPYLSGKTIVAEGHPEKELVVRRILEDMSARFEVLLTSVSAI